MDMFVFLFLDALLQFFDSAMSMFLLLDILFVYCHG